MTPLLLRPALGSRASTLFLLRAFQAEQSTGFKKDDETGSKAKKADLPQDVLETIERSKEDYEWLYERRTIREEEEK